MLSQHAFSHHRLSRDRLSPAHGGFTLIELLVSVVVLAIGLLGMAGLQTTGLNTNQSAYFRTQATNAISDILDRMRANPDGVGVGAYDNIDVSGTLPGAESCITDSAGCTPPQLANYDIREWAKLFKDVDNIGPNYRPLLPGSSATVVRTAGTATFTVTITWQETDWANNREKALEDKTLTIRVNL